MRLCWSKLLCAVAWWAFHVGGGAAIAEAEIVPSFLMESDPELTLPESVQKFPPNLVGLWLEALERPEVDMQRMAAETIARGHEHGVPGLEEAVPRLEQILQNEASHPAARFAAARALIALDSRASSEKLFAAAEAHGADLRQLIEPVLADWDSASAREVWVKRLGADETYPRDLILAIRGLGKVGEASAVPALLAIAKDSTRNPDVRLEAATAAGMIAESGLEEDARRLAGATGTVPFLNPLIAVRLLSRHSNEAATQLLIELAGHNETAVAASALERLNDVDSSLVLPLAETAIASFDSQVRRQGAASLLQNPSVERIAPLSGLLGDAHPDVRGAVAEGLLQLAKKPELDGPIREAALNMLAGERWQGQEQAALLLGALEHQPAADRLVTLLESPRVEVRVPAAWALSKLAVPETVPALISDAERLTELRRSAEQRGLDEQVAHLFEALGVLQAEDALPLLMQYVPKNVSQNNLSRGAAIWAIGRIKAGERDADIETALADRIMDFEPRPSEVPIVKQMSAVTLGRMGAVDQAEMLRDFIGMLETDLAETERGIAIQRVVLATNWAVRQLTGEELPPVTPLTAKNVSWFLEPLP